MATRLQTETAKYERQAYTERSRNWRHHIMTNMRARMQWIRNRPLRSVTWTAAADAAALGKRLPIFRRDRVEPTYQEFHRRYRRYIPSRRIPFRVPLWTIQSVKDAIAKLKGGMGPDGLRKVELGDLPDEFYERLAE